ncbi:DUF1801 domain-containing protein [Microcella daejeonensis]|uniref:iron chaperone n=1 Tax=Microcella daejeonensis TaxID=2994971 RepID=UPI00226D7C42|nr:DUF1801 domain-containing protein [Microcella daejeonensis]WAB84309.1 DUF1801 domain-containing protein [Microcella daejeonensis]
MAEQDDTGTMSARERAAMKERAAELRAEAKRAKGSAKTEQQAQDVRARIAEMPEADRVLAERVHALVAEEAPQLAPKTWYGMPAWARDGKVVVFFQGAEKFEARYATLGFSDQAALDEGTMWASSYALTGIGEAEEQRIRALLRRASTPPAADGATGP